MALSEATLAFLLLVTNYLNQCPLSDPSGYLTKCTPEVGETFDFIIVGGGSAGSTLAARLSENKEWKVLLIEAGGVPSNLSEAPATFFSLQGTKEDWQFKTEPGNHCLGLTNGRCNWPQGKALGGGSTINAMLAIPGDPHNFKEWVEMGNSMWSWEVMKPYFDKAFQQMKTSTYQSIMPTRNLLIEAAQTQGMNVNTPNLKIGYEDVNLTINANQRNNAAKAYLIPIHDRDNLCILTNSQVERIIFNKRKAIGVQLKTSKFYASKEVIISAGAVNTPKLLMLSGVGPKDQLEKQNIFIIKELPGVGQNLMDHLMYTGFFTLLPKLPIEVNITDFLEPYCKSRGGPIGQVDICNVVGWINTENITNYANIQLMHFTIPKTDNFFLPTILKSLGFNSPSMNSILEKNTESTILVTAIILSRPMSRGRIELDSRDINDPPKIYPGYLSHSSDMEVMLGAIKHMQQRIDTPAFSGVGAEIMDFEIPNCNHLSFNTDPYWECSIRNFGSTLYHPSGTCKMGDQILDEMTVVDQALKIHGLQNIRVIDASIMPRIVTGNTNIPVIAIAERGADLIKGSYKGT